jgi:hypothetical protein
MSNFLPWERRSPPGGRSLRHWLSTQRCTAVAQECNLMTEMPQPIATICSAIEYLEVALL